MWWSSVTYTLLAVLIDLGTSFGVVGVAGWYHAFKRLQHLVFLVIVILRFIVGRGKKPWLHVVLMRWSILFKRDIRRGSLAIFRRGIHRVFVHGVFSLGYRLVHFEAILVVKLFHLFSGMVYHLWLHLHQPMIMDRPIDINLHRHTQLSLVKLVVFVLLTLKHK